MENTLEGYLLTIALRNENSIKYGEFAKNLKLSGFFRKPELWKALGSDNDFKGWVKKQEKCCNCGKHNPVEAAHVRRNAGIAIKPTYAVIPLCAQCHRGIQHQHGESALNIDMDKKRIEYIEKWAWKSLKDKLNLHSMTDLSPERLDKFCCDNNIKR